MGERSPACRKNKSRNKGTWTHAARRIKSKFRLEVRLAADERGVTAATGIGFALAQLLGALPAVIVAGIPTVERAVVTWDEAARRCVSGVFPGFSYREKNTFARDGTHLGFAGQQPRWRINS